MEEDEFFEFSYKTPGREFPYGNPSWYEENIIGISKQREKQLPRKARHLKYLSDLELSVRTTSFLEAAGLTTIKQILEHNADELLELRNFGETSLKEVRMKLDRYGMRLKGD